METSTPRAWRTPDTLLILLAAGLLAALLVPWLPAGLFEPGRPVALEHYREAAAPLQVRVFADGGEGGPGALNLLFEGFTSGSRTGAAIGVIAFVLIVGGAFGLVQASGAMDNGLRRLLAGGLARRPAWLLAGLFALFSTGGAVFGMGEETIAFLALLLPLLRRLGYPPEVAVMATYVASQVGFATSWMNPFSVAVAQGIAGLPLLSGAGLRLALWATCTLAAMAWMLRYAARHRDPAATGAAVDAAVPEAAPLAWADHAVFAAIALTVGWIVWGVTAGGYYIPEIATQFFALGLACGVIAVASGRIGANAAAQAFTDGMRALVPCALVIALAKGVLGLLGGADPHQASVLNALLHGMGQALEGAPPLLAAQGMFAAQSVFNLFVSSGSAQAAITMPLMAGLGDLVGVSRQVSVLAFQLGDGLTNLVIPTSAAMMGALGVAGLDWTRWIRVIWRLELLLLGLGAVFITIAMGIGYV
jgi:uncharacterized ion transporter superfamily protein YfcC